MGAVRGVIADPRARCAPYRFVLAQARAQTMISPRYPKGCAEASQVCRLAFWSSSPNAGNSGNAWNVNFNNGNVNNNNRNNNNAVRLVRSGEWSVCW